MARFKLLVGQYIGADVSKAVDKTTGKRPSKTYTAPATVESELDLVKVGGPTKFARLGDKKSAHSAGTAPPLFEQSAEPEVAETEEVVEEPEVEEVPEAVVLDESDLNAMKIGELKAYAAERGINIKPFGNNRSKLISAVLASAAPVEEASDD